MVGKSTLSSTPMWRVAMCFVSLNCQMCKSWIFTMPGILSNVAILIKDYRRLAHTELFHWILRSKSTSTFSGTLCMRMFAQCLTRGMLPFRIYIKSKTQMTLEIRKRYDDSENNTEKGISVVLPWVVDKLNYHTSAHSTYWSKSITQNMQKYLSRYQIIIL